MGLSARSAGSNRGLDEPQLRQWSTCRSTSACTAGCVLSAHCRYWDHHWIWWTAPFIGGLTAGKLYEKFWLPKEQLAGLIPKNVARHLKSK